MVTSLSKCLELLWTLDQFVLCQSNLYCCSHVCNFLKLSRLFLYGFVCLTLSLLVQKRLAKEARAQELQAKNASLGKKVKDTPASKGIKGRGEASFYRVTCKVRIFSALCLCLRCCIDTHWYLSQFLSNLENYFI